MKRLIFAMALVSLSAMANIDTSYRFYATDYSLNTKKERFAAYMLKSDPCINVKMFKSNEETRYCKLGESGLDLERDAPTVYAGWVNVDSSGVRFIAAAPWNGQKCHINIHKKTISCSPTGK
ncbi:hypothetical protein F0249_01495 [Vibrio sp. 03-59-1]|uniref:hypothetical protein n=1 Tax=Vibrio sp. 03-59-1 TaxID=2607607 RepID=UPI001493719A|nr:hypothetical protein [Vibrio sp. 03-59-1]NOH82468.1 hypothetical protein [Vibrio sp. 03-59-1]